MSEQLITTINDQGIATLTFNHPEKHNAFDAIFINDILIQLEILNKNPDIRLLIITGNGESFSTGADLNWMRSMVDYDFEKNREDSKLLAELMHHFYHFSKPTLAAVNGNAFGGALGIIACCDIAIANEKANFCFSEVKLGLAPAVISPYILQAIGKRQTNRYFLSGELFSAIAAVKIGLIHETVMQSNFNSTIKKMSSALLTGKKQAQIEIKKMIHQLSPIDDQVTDYTVDLIAKLRISEEAQTGLNAFLSGRKKSSDE